MALLFVIDTQQDASETVTIAEQTAASDSSCPNGINRITGRCRSCADRTHFRSNGECVHKTMNHRDDPPCTDGKVYYSTYGCREVECPLGPPHGDAARDDDGYCLPDPGTTPPPPTTTPPNYNSSNYYSSAGHTSGEAAKRVGHGRGGLFDGDVGTAEFIGQFNYQRLGYSSSEDDRDGDHYW